MSAAQGTGGGGGGGSAVAVADETAGAPEAQVATGAEEQPTVEVELEVFFTRRVPVGTTAMQLANSVSEQCGFEVGVVYVNDDELSSDSDHVLKAKDSLEVDGVKGTIP